MGWTLGRYFFFRYATITTWFFLGIFALIFTHRLHRIGEQHVRPARLHLPARAGGLDAARADDHAADRALRRAVFRDGDAGLAQPQL